MLTTKLALKTSVTNFEMSAVRRKAMNLKVKIMPSIKATDIN